MRSGGRASSAEGASITLAGIEVGGQSLSIPVFLLISAGTARPRSRGSDEAARELVATQDGNPLLDMDTMPFDSSYEAARASHVGHAGTTPGG